MSRPAASPFSSRRRHYRGVGLYSTLWALYQVPITAVYLKFVTAIGAFQNPDMLAGIRPKLCLDACDEALPNWILSWTLLGRRVF